MGKQRNRHDELIHHLPNLQNFIKRDPFSYLNEFQQQLRHLNTWLTVSLNVTKEAPKKQMLELLHFIAHTLPCYPHLVEYTKVPSTWVYVLQHQYQEMHPELRLALVNALILFSQKYNPASLKKKNKASSGSSLTTSSNSDSHLSPSPFNLSMSNVSNESCLLKDEFISSSSILPSAPTTLSQPSLPLFTLDQVHQLCFTLLTCKDKVLRLKVLDFLVRSFRSLPSSHLKNLQPFVFQHLDSQPSTLFSLRALQLCIVLFKKKLWHDKIVANKIAQCCFLKQRKMQTMAIQFLLSSGQASLKKKQDHGSHSDFDDDEDSNDSGENSNDDTSQTTDYTHRSVFGSSYGMGSQKKQKAKLTQRHLNRAQFVSKITKKSKKNQRRLERTRKKVLKTCTSTLLPSSTSVSKKSTQKQGGVKTKFTPIEWLFDAHSFAESLLKQLKHTSGKLDFKLLQFQLISICIALHELLLPGFYTYVQKYLQPHQLEVTKFLAYTAQAVHSYVPPEWITSLIRKLVDQFIGDQCTVEVMTVGFHSLREIAKRMPLAIESDLLSDLVLYQSHREKSVAMAAKSLVAVYRELYPSILPRKERGKECTLAMKEGLIQDFKYGERTILTRVKGAELLEASYSKKKKSKSKEEKVKTKENAVKGHDEEKGEETGEEQGEGSMEAEDSEEEEEDDDQEIDSDDLEFLSEDELDLDEEEDDGNESEMESEEEREEEFSDDSANEEVNAEEHIDKDTASDDHPALLPKDSNETTNPSTSLPIEATKILTEEDYAQIAYLKQKMKSQQKRPYSSRSVYSSASAAAVDPETLLHLHKKQRLDKQTRLASLAQTKQEEGKKHIGPRFVKKEHMSKTKKEQAKAKNFKMITKSSKIMRKKRDSLKGKRKNKKQFKGRVRKNRGKK